MHMIFRALGIHETYTFRPEFPMRSLCLALFSLSILAPAFADEGHKHAPMPGERIGKVDFPVSCTKQSRAAFEHAVAKLHSFWYDAAETEFAAIGEREPSCAMANWGVAMTLYKPLWYPTSKEDIARANAALDRAKQTLAKTQRERDYLDAIGEYYRDTARPHAVRAKAYSDKMEQLAARYPKDVEAQIFYALGLRATADPQDKSYAIQRKVGEMLKPLLKKYPQHPGLAHYIIHTYDYAELASEGLDAARVYAKIAPSAPHALHMPSHIFTRLGLWDESEATNLASANAAKQHAAQGSKLAISEELHAMDYMMYAHLQDGEFDRAQQIYEQTIAWDRGPGSNDSGSYAQATIPARWALERKDWQTAATLPESTKSPYTRAITHWARALGLAKTGKLDEARAEVAILEKLREESRPIAGYPWHTMVEVQRLQAAGWIANAEGKKDEAIRLLREAADLEDRTDKHPVTPGAVLPAREQLADLLFELGDRDAAAKEYAATLQQSPKRLKPTKALESMKQVAAR
jgi:tetratricopeptide (TPR) repeat protein